MGKEYEEVLERVDSVNALAVGEEEELGLSDEEARKVLLTPDEIKALEAYRLQTGKAYPSKSKVDGIKCGLTYKQDAFAREVAKIPVEVPVMKDLAKAYRRITNTKKPWDAVKKLMADQRVLDRIVVYRKVYSTDRDTLLAEREALTAELKDAWDADKTICTGDRTKTPKVKTADLLSAFKDREALYIGETKPEDAGKKIIINITGDAKALIEQAKIIDAEVVDG